MSAAGRLPVKVQSLTERKWVLFILIINHDNDKVDQVDQVVPQWSSPLIGRLCVWLTGVSGVQDEWIWI